MTDNPNDNPDQTDDIDAVAALLAGMTAADGTNYLDMFREDPNCSEA